MKIIPLIAAALIVLASCNGKGDPEQETLDALNAEMPLEERVALCDGYGFDPDFTYFVWKSRWESIFALDAPDRGTFDGWIQGDVCTDEMFAGGKGE